MITTSSFFKLNISTAFNNVYFEYATIIEYASYDLLSFHKSPHSEKLQLYFNKKLLAVMKYAAYFVIFLELGRFP